MKILKINNLRLKNPLLLAPMVDVTNLPYRLICRESGASLAYTPMLYTSQILHKNKKTLELLKSTAKDKPLGIQITGTSIKEFQKLSPLLKKYALVDINCGCPSNKIIGCKAGSYLLKNTSKISRIIKILKSYNLTITVKIRLGFKKNNVIKIAKSIEKAGADAITLHPRLAIHKNSTPADHSYTKKLKKTLSIPLIANGDITNPKIASQLLSYADGIMIGRKAIGDPDIFRRTIKFIKTGKQEEYNIKKNIKYLKKYLTLSKKYKMINIPHIKYISSKFIKNISNASKYRTNLTKLKNYKEIKKFIESLNY